MFHNKLLTIRVAGILDTHLINNDCWDPEINLL